MLIGAAITWSRPRQWTTPSNRGTETRSVDGRRSGLFLQPVPSSSPEFVHGAWLDHFVQWALRLCIAHCTSLQLLRLPSKQESDPTNAGSRRK